MRTSTKNRDSIFLRQFQGLEAGSSDYLKGVLVFTGIKG